MMATPFSILLFFNEYLRESKSLLQILKYLPLSFGLNFAANRRQSLL